jgi:two-component system, NarL family, invasion response regulator UvrY
MNLLLVDDHAIVRDGLKRLLSTAMSAQVHEAADGREALAQLRRQPIDLVILDLTLPGLGGIELLKRIVQTSRARILVFSMHAEPLYVTRALDAGAVGYVSKNISPDELLIAVQRVAAGGRYVEQEIAQQMATGGAPTFGSVGQLTARELEIMRLLGQGRSVAEIASALGVGYKTVANTLSQMKAKLGVARTADLVRMAIETGVA